jgi:hypothetical protein
MLHEVFSRGWKELVKGPEDYQEYQDKSPEVVSIHGGAN